MASYMLVVLSIVLLSAVAPFVKAEDFIIGDASGWIPDFNYTAWVEGKHFRVGDNIIFTYAEGVHNVIPVGGAAFKACNASGATNNVFSSGNDVVPLKTAGRKWYICGKGDHCERGQKLVITVSAAATSPSPSPSPTSPSASSPPPPTSSSWRIATHICMVSFTRKRPVRLLNTVIETPPTAVVGVVDYVKAPCGLRCLNIGWAQHLGEELRRRFYKNWCKSKNKAFTKYSEKYESEEGKKLIQVQLFLKRNSGAARKDEETHSVELEMDLNLM
ncbi:hypothetical protein Cni_G03329 [Canna indica]|uniref:Phytocyanin domain-containing protein n=1 Tax=Canna indica TaxID=4628 RepID=A0AAQ3JQV9_9LILI|nr:hypothetical protein Cni_G03329 [Canna indica]